MEAGLAAAELAAVELAALQNRLVCNSSSSSDEEEEELEGLLAKRQRHFLKIVP